MPTGDPPVWYCACPNSWWGTVPPVCPVHNPSTYTYPTTAVGYSTWVGGTALPQPGLSFADIERIARRVAELMREAAADNAARDKPPAFEGSVDELEALLDTP